ncbi:MAG: hypothetical protein JO170_08695, partial [Verrucomicrobia bacterium]|nr:hypothetical protein [Verrucomicrobiota bacterium]
VAILNFLLADIGFALLCRAKANWNPERQAEFVATLREAEKKIQEALDRLPDNPSLLGHKGYIFSLLGNVTTATAALRDAIRLVAKSCED